MKASGSAGGRTHQQSSAPRFPRGTAVSPASRQARPGGRGRYSRRDRADHGGAARGGSPPGTSGRACARAGEAGGAVGSSTATTEPFRRHPAPNAARATLAGSCRPAIVAGAHQGGSHESARPCGEPPSRDRCPRAAGPAHRQRRWRNFGPYGYCWVPFSAAACDSCLLPPRCCPSWSDWASRSSSSWCCLASRLRSGRPRRL